jgi:AMMECR1 domain-containing protein
MRFLLFVCVAACSLLSQSRQVLAQTDWARELESPRVQAYALSLSRKTLELWAKTGRTLPTPRDVPRALRRRSGVIVTFEKRGQVAPRGCRGTIEATRESLAREIICNTIAAASRDARVKPVRADEVGACRISLSVILRAQPIQNLSQHDVEKNGLMAKSGARIGLVLPYEGRDPRVQWEWAKKKAGLRAGEGAAMFEVFAVRFREAARAR